MNYKKIHDSIISRAQTRILPDGVYTESHHIIPRCMGGTNHKDNLVQLTAREHYIIHWLLYKHYLIPKLAYAWNIMRNYNAGRDRYVSHTFEYARIAFAKAVSVTHTGNTHRRGKSLSDETKKKISAAGKGKPSHRKGQTLPKETCLKLSVASKGKEKSPQHKQNMALAAKKKFENKTSILSSIIECPHCAKTGAYANMKRWHFDHCKSLSGVISTS